MIIFHPFFNFSFIFFSFIIFHSQLCCSPSVYSLESSNQAAVTLSSPPGPSPPPGKTRREYPCPKGLGLWSCCNLRKEGKRPGLLSQQSAPVACQRIRALLTQFPPSFLSPPLPQQGPPPSAHTGCWVSGKMAPLHVSG